MVVLEIDTRYRLEVTGKLWWGADVPDEPPKPLSHPVTWVLYTYENLDCDDVMEGLQKMQQRHIKKRHYTDIGYNFMIDADGKVYEGRGWKAEAERPSHYWGLENNCLDICYLGNFEDPDTNPTPKQYESGFYLLLYGLKESYISPQYRNIGFRDEHIPNFSLGQV